MTEYMSFEWLKLNKRWMPRVLLAILLSLLVIYFLGQGDRAGKVNLFFPRAWLATLYFTAFIGPFLLPVLGGSWAGNEYGWGTIRAILTRRPQRVEHALAALGVLFAGVGLALLAALAIGGLAGVLVGMANGQGAVVSGVFSGAFVGTVFQTLLAAWFVAGFYLILAYAAAVVFRSAAVGIGIGIGSTLAQILLIQIFRSLGGFWETVSNHLPIIYTESLVQDVAHSGFVAGTGLARMTAGDPSIPSSLVAIGAWIVGLLAVTLVTVRKRDVTD